MTSLSELPARIGELDALLIGGGYLLRFDAEVAPGYGPDDPAIHHPTGYWLTPAMLALQHGVPLVWNGPGMHCNELPGWARPLIELVLGTSAYIAVRDEPTRQTLAAFVAVEALSVIPDTGFGLGRTLAANRWAATELDQKRAEWGLPERYLVIQASESMIPLARFLQRHAAQLDGIGVVALPIGPALCEDAGLIVAEIPGAVRLPSWPHPLLLAEIVRNAVAVAGHSYHLAITALIAGVPVFSPAAMVGKYTVFAGSAGIAPLPAGGEPDLERFLSHLSRRGASPEVAVALAELARHWDRIAAIVEDSTEPRRARHGALALGRFLQSLPHHLEGQPATLLTARAGLERRIAELEEELQAARRDLTAAEERSTALLASTSWRATALLRFLGRQLGR